MPPAESIIVAENKANAIFFILKILLFGIDYEKGTTTLVPVQAKSRA